MPRRPVSAADDIDRLFQLPLAEFTAARNALALTLKKRGDADVALQVKALSKPSIPAWAINQVYWIRRDEMDALLQAGDRFRQAQRAQLAGKPAGLREALEAWQGALATATTLAADLLRAGGHDPSAQIQRRIATSLEALATRQGAADAPRVGRLLDDLEPPGFDALAALVPRQAGVPAEPSDDSKVIAFGRARGARTTTSTRAEPSGPADTAAIRREARARAERAIAAAEQALQEARTRAMEAGARLKAAAAKARRAEQKRASTSRARVVAEERFERAAQQADEATGDARQRAREAEDAAQAVSDAEREVERLRRDGDS
ncbi:MAG: hypothetical protein FJW23_00960 [Acidimicrobiia bacterium]|nr:hypothetical protein [Acidimicrobiia bacterium]